MADTTSADIGGKGDSQTPSRQESLRGLVPLSGGLVADAGRCILIESDWRVRLARPQGDKLGHLNMTIIIMFILCGTAGFFW
jgi:hypothetical protein